MPESTVIVLAHSYREVIESDVCMKVSERIELPTCLPANNRRQGPMSVVGKRLHTSGHFHTFF